MMNSLKGWFLAFKAGDGCFFTIVTHIAQIDEELLREAPQILELVMMGGKILEKQRT